jgi:hypothetical protein
VAKETDDPNLVVVGRAIAIRPKLYAYRHAARRLRSDMCRRRMSKLGSAPKNTADEANCGALEAAADTASGVERGDGLQIVAAAGEQLDASL